VRVMAYSFGAFVSLCTGIFLYGLMGVVGAGIVGAAVVFLISVSIIRGWRSPLRESSGEARTEAWKAGAYSQSGHGGYFGSDGGGGGFGGGCDGGGGGSC
jgi:hypothetical protein